MRTLSATLLAAQKAAVRRPYVEAKFDDFWGDRPRLRFSRYYTGSEVEGPSAVVVAFDGALIRARIDPGTNTLYTSRVTSPGSGSTYSSWTSHGAVGAGTYCALAVASSNNLLLMYVAADTVTIQFKVSLDFGATWGSVVAGPVAASAIKHVACAYGIGGSGALGVFWSVGAVVWGSYNLGFVAAWTNSAASITGLAVEFQGDWGIVVCGTEVTTAHPKAWSCIYGDGLNQALRTWSSLVEVAGASNGSGVSYVSAAVEYLGVYRCWFSEKYTGSLAYSRLHFSTMEAGQNFKQELWSEPTSFSYTGDYGVSCAASAAGMWLVAAAGVWFADYPDEAAFNATADVLEASVEQDSRPSSASGRATVRVVLDNSHGRYSRGGADIGSVGLGRRLKLSFGLKTSAGDEASTGPGYWVTGLSQEWRSPPAPNAGGARAGAGRSVLVVEAADAWHILESWKARRQLQWAAGAKTIAQLLDYLFARAGLEYSTGSASSQIAALTPAFTVQPGESGATAVSRLLAKVQDRIVMRSGAGLGIVPLAADASAYTYGTDHGVLGGRYRSVPAQINRARVVGNAVFDERFDFTEQQLGAELIRNVLDFSLTTTTQAGDRADAVIRAAAMEAEDLEISVPLNCGAEVYDVVTVTDAVVGLSAAKRRVLSLGLRYQASGGREPKYEAVLGLGAA